MAEGARIAEAAGAEIIDINMGCPARHVTGGQSGSALMRDLDHAVEIDRGDDIGGESAGDAEDAARLGRSLAQRAGTGAPRRGGRRADDFGAWPHALPVLQGRRRLGRGARGQGCDRYSACRQRRYHLVREGCGRARNVRRRRGHGRPRRAGPAMVARPDRAPHRNRHCRIRAVAGGAARIYPRAL